MSERACALAAAYDDEARATGWHGPEVALGLAFRYVRPGESILDLGIGTGLASELFRKAGLRTWGVDRSKEMLEACCAKGFTDLTLCDLTETPYPFAAESFDHAVCVGVLDFFSDPAPVFREVARIMRLGGVFVFTIGDRREDEEPPDYVVESEFSGQAAPVTMHRSSASQVSDWLEASELAPISDLPFSAFMDRERTRLLPQHAYLAARSEATRLAR